MRAGLRFGIAAFAVALTLAPPAALAQNTAEPASNAAGPATNDTIGPRELENFSLNGTVTRPAPVQPSRTVPAPATTRPQPAAPAAAPPADRTARPAGTQRPAPAPSVTMTLPPPTVAPETATPAPPAGEVFSTPPGIEP